MAELVGRSVVADLLGTQFLVLSSSVHAALLLGAVGLSGDRDLNIGHSLEAP